MIMIIIVIKNINHDHHVNNKNYLQVVLALYATAKAAARMEEKMERVRLLKMLAVLPLLKRSDHHHH